MHIFLSVLKRSCPVSCSLVISGLHSEVQGASSDIANSKRACQTGSHQEQIAGHDHFNLQYHQCCICEGFRVFSLACEVLVWNGDWKRFRMLFFDGANLNRTCWCVATGFACLWGKWHWLETNYGAGLGIALLLQHKTHHSTLGRIFYCVDNDLCNMGRGISFAHLLLVDFSQYFDTIRKEILGWKARTRSLGKVATT